MVNKHASARAVAHWLHLGLLIGLVSVLQVGNLLIGPERVFAFSVLARSLYDWFPILAGIAASTAGPHSKVTRSGVVIGLAVVALMIGLDLTVTLGYTDSTQKGAVYSDLSVMAFASGVALYSWTRTAYAWATGHFALTAGVSDVYGFGDPRPRAVQAFLDGGLILTVFASIGFVIAAMSWVRANVDFKRRQDARTVNIVLAWMIAPIVVELSIKFAYAQRFRALFRNGAIWAPAVPHVVILALGLLAWWYTARYREPEES